MVPTLPELEAPKKVAPPPVFVPPVPKPLDPAAEPLKGPTLDLSKKRKPSVLGLPGLVHAVTEETPDHAMVGAQGGVLPQSLPLIPPVELKPVERPLPPCVKAMQLIIEGKQQDAIRCLEAYDKETQEFYLRYLPMLAIFANKRIDELNTREIGMLHEQLIGLLDMLRPRCQLAISRICFSKEIRGFAHLVPLPDNHAFLAGTKDRPGELVQLYVELKNFASEPTAGADYLTKLVCTLELHDAKEEKVWSHTYDRDLTTYPRKSRLNDFYSNFRFYVPAIAPGQYRLTVQIADETNPELRRVVRRSLDLRVTPVAGQPTLR